MALFPFRHTPEGLAYGDKPHWLPAADGQAPTVGIPVRLLGVDAPEARYGGASRDNPGKLDGALASFLAKAGDGLDAGLKAHLEKRLVNGASTRQVAAGEAAWRHFEEMVKRRLDRGTSKSGKPLAPRSLFCMASKAPFDRHGRLHAYVNASYDRKEREAIPPARRPTFNLEMLQAGQAVSLLVYPNLPGAADLELVQAAVRTEGVLEGGRGGPAPL
jgi:endonuclease YncB( thermonuclease family)